MGSYLGNPKGRASKACDAIDNGGGTIRVNGRVANGGAALLDAISCLDPQSLGSLLGELEDAQLQMERAQLPNQYIPEEMGKGRPIININIPGCIFNPGDSMDVKWH